MACVGCQAAIEPADNVGALPRFPDLCVLCLAGIDDYADAWWYAQTHLEVPEPDIPARLRMGPGSGASTPLTRTYTESEDGADRATLRVDGVQTLRQVNILRQALANAPNVTLLNADGEVLEQVPDPPRIPTKDDLRDIFYDVLKRRAAGEYSDAPRTSSSGRLLAKAGIWRRLWRLMRHWWVVTNDDRKE